MTNSNAVVGRDFNTALNNITTSVEFDAAWMNGTGYMDGAVKYPLAAGAVVKSMCPKTERRLILVGTEIGTVVAFERYSPKVNLGQPFILTFHAPQAIVPFIGEPQLTVSAFNLIVTCYHVAENISTHVDALLRSVELYRRAAAKREEIASRTPIVEAEVVEVVTSTTKEVSEFDVLVAALASTGGRVIDDHSNGSRMLQLAGLATLDKEDSSIPVALISSSHFSLNRVYLDKKGCAHVSRESVGGVLMSTGSKIGLELAIETYNDQQPQLAYSCGMLNNVTLSHI